VASTLPCVPGRCGGQRWQNACADRNLAGGIASHKPEWRNGRRGGLKIRCPQGRVGSSPSSGIAKTTGKNGVRDRTAPHAHPLKGSTVGRIVGRSDLALLGRAARPGCADRRTRGCDGRRQDRRSMRAGFGEMFVGGSGGRVFAVGSDEWRPGAKSGAGAGRQMSGREKTEGALSPASPTPRPGRAHGSVSPSCVAPIIPLMRRFISSREVSSAPPWPPTRGIEVRFPEPEHLEGIWIPVGVFHMPARQRDRQELCPSRDRWKTQIVHVVTVV
jgi:hypothetical protein